MKFLNSLHYLRQSKSKTSILYAKIELLTQSIVIFFKTSLRGQRIFIVLLIDIVISFIGFFLRHLHLYINNSRLSVREKKKLSVCSLLNTHIFMMILRESVSSGVFKMISELLLCAQDAHDIVVPKISTIQRTKSE